MVGHNVNFDLGFLTREMELAGATWDDDITIVDTLRMARGLLPSLGSYSLTNVVSSLGIAREQKHRAMDDVALTGEVFLRLLSLARDRAIHDVVMLARLFGQIQDEHVMTEEQKIALIEDAMAASRSLHMVYFSPQTGSRTVRKVTPRKIVQGYKRVVMVAYCHLRKEEREFRLDRILELEQGTKGGSSRDVA